MRQRRSIGLQPAYVEASKFKLGSAAGRTSDRRAPRQNPEKGHGARFHAYVLSTSRRIPRWNRPWPRLKHPSPSRAGPRRGFVPRKAREGGGAPVATFARGVAVAYPSCWPALHPAHRRRRPTHPRRCPWCSTPPVASAAAVRVDWLHVDRRVATLPQWWCRTCRVRVRKTKNGSRAAEQVGGVGGVGGCMRRRHSGCAAHANRSHPLRRGAREAVAVHGGFVALDPRRARRGERAELVA